MNQVSDFFKKLFSSSDWPPRWHCGQWTEFHGWLYIISDLLIWSAYFAIPIVIIRYVSRKENMRFTKLYFLFAAFILACGATHFLDAVAFWIPVYRLSALVRFITGVISWVTVFYLVKYLPVIFSLRSQVALENEIEERKKTELELKKSRTDYELLVGGVKDYAIFMLDAEGRVASWNSGAENIKGYQVEEIIGKPVDIFYTPEEVQRGEPARNLQMALQHGRCETRGWRVRKDKSIFWADVVLSALYDDDNQFYGYAKVTRDITEKRETEERRLFLASIASNIQDPYISTDSRGNITRWNHAAELLLEWKAEEVVGKTGTEILKIDYLQTTRELVVEAYNKNKYWQGEVIYHTRSGRPVNVLVTVSQLKDTEDNLIGNLAMVKDITERKKGEVKLREFEHFFNNSNDFSCIANAGGYFEIVNASFNKILGYSENELATMPFINFVHPDDVAATMQAYDRLKAGEDLIQFTNRYRKKDGSYLLLEWNATPNNNTGKLYCIARDITERKKTEDALKQLNEDLEQRVKERTTEIEKKENRFRALLDNNYDIISLADESFKIIYRSPSAIRITGWADEDTMGADITGNLHPDDKEQASKTASEVLSKPGIPVNCLFRSRHKNGNYLWMEGVITNLLNHEYIHAIVFNLRDVTARIDAEAKLAASEMRFRMLIENSAEGIDMSDEFSNNIYRSPGAVKITGILPSENQMSLIHPDDLEIIKSKQAELIENPGVPIPFQARCRHTLGHYIWVEGTLTNLLHVEGVHAIVTNFHDITERKELEVLLHKANTLARIGGWEVDLVKETVFWSDITREIHETEYDYVPDLNSGINFYKEGPGRDLITQKVTEAIALGTPWEVELQIITAKNNERWVRSIGETEFSDGKCIRIYGSFQDITERKKAEIERERLSERLQLATQSAQLGLWDWDVKNNELIWDEGMYRLYNLAENEFSSVYEGWASRIHPEDRQRVDADIQLALAGKKEYNPEFRIIWKDSSVHYIKASGYIEKDHEGNLVRMTGFNWDVTERRKAEDEIKNLNIELEQKVISRTEQLRKINEELEAFSYSVSHDLRAPLRGIIGFTNILEEDYSSKLDAEAMRITGVIKNNTIKMGNLIDDLLSFSRLGRQPISKIAVNSNTIIHELINEPGFINKEREINWTIPQLPTVDADPNTIRQVWMNLLSNAVKYTAAVKHAAIEIGSYTDSGNTVFFVKDNGVGFDTKYKDKLFKVFQRLHSAAQFEGTGVGLAIVEKIITKHEGAVWAEAEPGNGACFYFSLPNKATD